MYLDTGDTKMPEAVPQTSRAKTWQYLLSNISWELKKVKEYFKSGKAFLVRL